MNSVQSLLNLVFVRRGILPLFLSSIHSLRQSISQNRPLPSTGLSVQHLFFEPFSYLSKGFNRGKSGPRSPSFPSKTYASPPPNHPTPPPLSPPLPSRHPSFPIYLFFHTPPPLPLLFFEPSPSPATLPPPDAVFPFPSWVS